MKYCCIKRKITSKIKIGISFLLCGVLMLIIFTDGIVRKLISEYPITVASGFVNEIMDLAMNRVLEENEISPKEIDNVTYNKDGEALYIESNTTLLSKVKTQFSKEFADIVKEKGNFISVNVPLGTLIGNEYTLGRGPKISFKIQYSCTLNTTLKNSFISAGVNNTLHTVELNVTNKIHMVIPWGHRNTTVSTNYIVAETVIVGKTPEAFTNIYGANDEITDDVIDHGAELE